jgi:molybdate transport system ATP-binding protein
MSLEFKVKKDFGGFTLDMELNAENEVLALLGASGCGKSMTLKCISGIVTPDEGRIVVNGKVLFDSEKKINLPPQERHVGLLFQNYALFPNMTVEQNIMTGMNGFDMSRAEKREACRDMMKKFYLDGLEKHRPSQLSGGQQQRVALARIMVSKPSILMLDEPFSALDSFLRWELEQELMRVLEDFEGTSIIVSHNRDEVYRISDHIAVISDGRVDCFGEKKTLFMKPPTYQCALLTGCRNFSRTRYIDENHIEVTDWNAVFECKASPDVKFIAARPHFMKPVETAGKCTAKFKVIKSIDNLTEMILLLKAEGGQEASSDYTELNVRIAKDEWKPFEGREELMIEFTPANILLLDR